MKINEQLWKLTKIYEQICKDYKKTTLPQILSADQRLIDWWEGLG